MKTCRVWSTGRRAWFSSPYDAEYIRALRDSIPPRRFGWSKTERAWWVDASWADAAIRVAQRFFTLEFTQPRPVGVLTQRRRYEAEERERLARIWRLRREFQPGGERQPDWGGGEPEADPWSSDADE